eukprot:SAG11_NODE_24319_length_375_cov_0.565217_1_plen_77_part_10
MLCRLLVGALFVGWGSAQTCPLAYPFAYSGGLRCCSIGTTSPPGTTEGACGPLASQGWIAFDSICCDASEQACDVED